MFANTHRKEIAFAGALQLEAVAANGKQATGWIT
jgi:hypothetical protein